MRKSAAADFFLYVPQSETYRIAKRYIVSAGYIAPKAYRAPCGRGVKEQKSPARGDFTPSEQPARRSLFEAHLWGVAPYPTKGTF